MKLIVVQIGARHHYAIPRMLEQAGVLEALYTDACAVKGCGRLLNSSLPTAWRKGQVAKLLQRVPEGVPPKKIKSTDHLLLRQVLGYPNGDPIANTQYFGNIFEKQIKRWGTGKATGVYSMFPEGINYLRWIKQQGMAVITDVFITPIAHRIVAKEQQRFPDWEDMTPYDERIEAQVQVNIELADLLLCPGNNVVAGLRAFGNFDPQKAIVVPYGSGACFHERINRPIPGRVLFGGTADLRKGIHYFAASSQLLSESGKKFMFRVAGNVSPRVREHPESKFLEFLGRISRTEMLDELLKADVLVLPTLAEGSASVINEALVIGLPVITTPSAGSVVEDGISGLIVGERDSKGLADAIYKIVLQREIRDQLAAGAFKAALQLTEEAWSNRLIKALNSLSQEKAI